MGLSAGWLDSYPYTVEGNYLAFGDRADGEYVVRATTDANHTITESNEADNVAYAHFRVTGDSLVVLERGFGASHLDPNKVVVDDSRQPSILDPKCVPDGPCPADPVV